MVCCVCFVCAWVGSLFSYSSICLILISAKPHQMPPRRDPTQEALQQLITAQAQMMQMMTQFMQNNNNHNHNNNDNPPPPPPPPPPQVDRLTRFLRLRPNKFSSATEPIVADDWPRSVNKDLVTCECTDAEKIRFTAHLLEGPAAMWWGSEERRVGKEC